MLSEYSKEYTDYVCVDALGELIEPNYVTDHFKVVLKEKGLKQSMHLRKAH